MHAIIADGKELAINIHRHLFPTFLHLQILHEYVPSSVEEDHWYVSRIVDEIRVGSCLTILVADISIDWNGSYLGLEVEVAAMPTSNIRRKCFRERKEKIAINKIVEYFIETHSIIENQLKQKEVRRIELQAFIDKVGKTFGELPAGVHINEPIDKTSDCLLTITKSLSFDKVKLVIDFFDNI